MPLPTDPWALPDPGPEYADALDAGLRQLGLTLSPEARRAIDAQVRLLLAWNPSINLTAIRAPEAIARLHVLDSLSAILPIRERVAGSPAVLDLGSGAGYPGVPVSVALPAARLTLVDSVAKKTRFLAAVAGATERTLAPGTGIVAVEAVSARAEQLAVGDRRAGWDVVTVRAVGPMVEVAELGMPLLRRGGLLVCWKRQSSPEVNASSCGLERELQDARDLIGELGGDPAEVLTADAEGRAGHRLVIVRKARPTPPRFPRSPAERRRPLLR